MFNTLIGVLAGLLSIVSFTLLLILTIPALVWIYRTRNSIKNYTDTEDWLEINPQIKDAGAARKSLRKMAIWRFQKYSGRKKLLTISVTVIFLVLSSWLIWEILPFQIRTNTVYNDDSRVFWDSSADSSTQTLTIKGANTPLLDVRSCRVHFILPFNPVLDGNVNITSSWILSYYVEGYVTLTVEQWVYDMYENPLVNKIVFSKSIESGHDENLISNTTFTNTGYTCYDNFDYYIGVVLSVWLKGFSTVNATLSVASLTATI